MTRGARGVAAIAVIVALFGTIVIAVRASYGAFKSGYRLTAIFDHADYGFGPGVEVDYLGIDQGHVTRIQLLPDHRVEAFLKIDAGFVVPEGTSAQVHNRSLFGDPYVDLVFPAHPTSARLAPGSAIAVTSVDADTGDLIRTATPLLDGVSGQDVLALVTNLDQATAGEGANIAKSIHDGAQLASLYANTINAQITALDAFTSFQQAITPTASSFNTLAAQANAALPTLNAAEDQFQQALDSVNTFAAKLADVIASERPNFDQLLNRGDNLVRLLAMREPQIEQTVSGLATYFTKFAAGTSPETLPNGTKFAYFKNFVAINDITNLICGLLDPPSGGPAPAQLQPLLSALGAAGLGCKTVGPAQPVSAPAAANDLMNQIAGQIGAPQPQVTLNLGDLINSLLGRG